MFDVKKDLRQFYLPPTRPTIVEVPAMTFVMVDGAGDPNDEQGAYARAVQALYSLTYTIKMSPRAGSAVLGSWDHPSLGGGVVADQARGEVGQRWAVTGIRCGSLPECRVAAEGVEEGFRGGRSNCGTGSVMGASARYQNGGQLTVFNATVDRGGGSVPVPGQFALRRKADLIRSLLIAAMAVSGIPAGHTTVHSP